PTTHESPWFAAQHLSPEEYAGTYDPAFAEAGQQPQQQPGHELAMVPSGPVRERPLGVPAPREASPQPAQELQAGIAPGLPVAPAEPSDAVHLPHPSTGADLDSELSGPGAGATPGPAPSPEEEPVAEDEPKQVISSNSSQPVGDQTLTVVDRYFLAWEGYIAEYGQEPTAPQLSKHLASRGILNRSGSPVAPATLRRYLLEFRIYNVWAELCDAGAEPNIPAVMEELARRGISGQYNRPLEAATVEEFLANFRRRYQVFSLDISNATS
ncbi:hypothetical protein AB0L98_34845, partial [Streptomyces xanthochromogenes]